MYIVFLRFTENKANAPKFMEAHVVWLNQNIEQGQVALAGGMVDKSGGCIIAYGLERHALEAILAEDPFVQENIVTAEIIEVTPSKVDQRLEFLCPGGS